MRSHEIGAAALESVVFSNPNHNMEVTARALSFGANLGWRRLALTRKPNDLTVIDTVWDAHDKFTLRRDSALPSAFLTFVFDDRATAAALWASGDHSEHAAKPRLRDLALSATSGALRGLRAGLRTRTGAGIAHVETLELDFAFAALKRLFEFDLDFGLKVVSARRSTLRPSTRLLPEDVVEHREDVVDMHLAKVVGGILPQARVSVAIVELTSFWV
jgi:hypothetical protein